MGDDRKFKLTMLNPDFAKLSHLTAEVLKSLDVNGDKELVIDEYRALDRNGDRFLVRKELQELLGEMKGCDGLCRIFADDSERVDEAIAELAGIEFYGDVFMTEFRTVDDLVAKRMAQGYRMNWYRVLKGNVASPRADAAKKFLADMSALMDEYSRTSAIPQEKKMELLSTAADNYTDIFDTLVSLFRHLEEKEQDRDMLENSIFILNHNLGFIGRNPQVSLGPRNDSGKYEVSMIVQNAGL